MFSFRPLSFSDMPQMYYWLNMEFVKKWFRFVEYSSIEEVINQYGCRITGNLEKNYIIVCDNMDIGYIQTCMTDSYPPYSEHIAPEMLEYSSSIDIFIGHQDYIYKGFGAAIIKDFLNIYLFNNSQVDKCIIGPEPENFSAIKMYEKAGFKWYKNIQIDNDYEQYLMVLYKKDFYNSLT